MGGDARVDLELRAAGPTPQVTVTDVFDDGRRAARFITPALERGQPARAAYRIPTDRRGRFTVGPAVVGITDPFGLTHRFVEIGRHRRRDRAPAGPRAVRARTAAPGQRRSSAQRRALVPVPSPAHDEFLTLRDYEVGDDLRRIHWRSTARLGELVVREDESAWQPETVLVLDNRAGAHRGGDATRPRSRRSRRSRCASVAPARTVDILTTAGRRLGSVGGEGLRIETLLDELAVLDPRPGRADRRRDPPPPRAGTPRHARRRHRRARRPDAVHRAGRHRVTGHARRRAAARPPRVGGAVTVVDGRPGELVADWNRAMAAGAARGAGAPHEPRTGPTRAGRAGERLGAGRRGRPRSRS